MADPFDSALRDHALDSRTEPLVQRDGEESLAHPIEAFYFEPFDPDAPSATWLLDRCRGPVLDAGAGVGRLALPLQERFETVALEVSETLVETLADRGVEHPTLGDLFDLPATVPEDRFETVVSIGTQASLAASHRGLVELLEDLASVTGPGGTVILDSYDPSTDGVEELLGYRADPTPGVAFRVFHFEYDGAVGPTLLFRLVSPAVLEAAAAAAGWAIESIDRPGESEYYYRVALEKR